MYRHYRLAVVMPAHNVERNIATAVASVPSYVDTLIVVDDASEDDTAKILAASRRPGLAVVRHQENQGVGAAIATGYDEALARGVDISVVMAGDGQMDPADLPSLLDPIIERRADYVKGNRFRHPSVWQAMPWLRLIGNVFLSLLTRMSSGYWRLFDSQCGYTAIAAPLVRAVGPRNLFPRYGYLNDLLARLRHHGARVVDVPVRPVYDGQYSGIRLWTIVYPIGFVIVRSFAWRVWQRVSKGSLRRPAVPSLAGNRELVPENESHACGRIILTEPDPGHG